MSKMWRNILIIVLVIAVLCGALFFLLRSPEPDSEDPNTDDPDTTVTLVDVPQKDGETGSRLNNVKITSAQYGTFEVVQKKDGTLTVKGYEDLAPYVSLFDSLETALTEIKATQKVTDSGAAADFGFDKPQASFTVTYRDGQTRSFLFGAEEPYGSGDYFKFTDSDAIYLVDTSLLDTVGLDPIGYIDPTLYSSPATPDAADDSQTVSTVLRDFELTGRFYGKSGLSLRLVGDSDTGEYIYTNYVITKPFVRGSNSDKIGDTYLSASALTAQKAVVPRYTAADLKKYGLSEPYIQAKLHTAARIQTTKDKTTTTTYQNVEAHTVRLGNKTEDGTAYYGTVDDNPSIFLIDASSLPWAELTYTDCVSPLLFLRDIKTVGSVTCTMDGKTTEFVLTHHTDEEDSDKNLTVTVGGETSDTANFRSLYQVMMGLSRTGDSDKKPAGTPTLRLVLKDTAGKTVTDVKVYDAGASIALVENGEETYKVSAGRLRNLKQQIENYLSGKTVSTNG